MDIAIVVRLDMDVYFVDTVKIVMVVAILVMIIVIVAMNTAILVMIIAMFVIMNAFQIIKQNLCNVLHLQLGSFREYQ